MHPAVQWTDMFGQGQQILPPVFDAAGHQYQQMAYPQTMQYAGSIPTQEQEPGQLHQESRFIYGPIMDHAPAFAMPDVRDPDTPSPLLLAINKAKSKT